MVDVAGEATRLPHASQPVVPEPASRLGALLRVPAGPSLASPTGSHAGSTTRWHVDPEVAADSALAYAARLFGIDPAAMRCGLEGDSVSSARPQAAQLRADGAMGSAWSPNGPTTRREMLSWLSSPLTRWFPI